MDGDVGQGSQRSQEDLLPLTLLRVVRPWRNKRREVADARDVVSGEQEFAHPVEVEPFVGRVSDRSVVEVEPVDVDVGSYAGQPRTKC